MILVHLYLAYDAEETEINQQSFPATGSEAYPGLDANIRGLSDHFLLLNQHHTHKLLCIHKQTNYAISTISTSTISTSTLFCKTDYKAGTKGNFLTISTLNSWKNTPYSYFTSAKVRNSLFGTWWLWCLTWHRCSTQPLILLKLLVCMPRAECLWKVAMKLGRCTLSWLSGSSYFLSISNTS